MNQMEIWALLDSLLAKTESEIEKVFALRLKAILFQVSEMHRKYSIDGKEPSWTDLNKYNRFQKEMEVISKMFNDDYKQLVKLINQSLQTQYVEDYLRHAYLFQMFASTEMGFTIPSMAVITAAVANPVEFLTLHKVLEQHRNEIIRKINIEISQSLIAGEGYATMAKRIENAVSFNQKKARLVARTEAGRCRSIAEENAAEKASKHAKMDKVWQSALDLRVRAAHRELDGQKADKEGYFHYDGLKAKGPHLWFRANLDINCRCVVIRLVNGMFPEYRRGRDYTDASYQQKLADRIDKYMEDGQTYAQSLKRAQKEIHPPNKVIKYVEFEDWKKELGG